MVTIFCESSGSTHTLKARDDEFPSIRRTLSPTPFRMQLDGKRRPAHETAPMTIDPGSIPYYLVLRSGWPPYVLNSDRQVLRRQASPLLLAFARTRGAIAHVDDSAWNGFSDSEGLTVVERRETGFFSLVAGNETERQLQLLTTL